MSYLNPWAGTCIASATGSLSVAAISTFLFLALGCSSDVSPTGPSPEREHNRTSSKSAGYPVGNFLVQECSSGVDYPAKAEEVIDLEYGSLSYHLRVLHPKITPGPHFSIPFFWASDRQRSDEEVPQSMQSLNPHIGGLSWISLNRGYFFAEKNGSMRGFMMESGFDNADWGMDGLLYIFKGEKGKAWSWAYRRSPNLRRGSYLITDARDANKPAPTSLVKRLTAVLDHAAEKANHWPGP